MKNLSKIFLTFLLVVSVFFLFTKGDILALENEEVSSYSYGKDNSLSSYTDNPENWLTDYATVGFQIGVIVISLASSIAMYVYTSLAFSKIAEKLNYEKKWFAWVPILNIIMIFELGDQNPMLLFLLLIPGIGGLIVGIMSIIAMMNIAEKRGYDKMLGLLMLVPLGNLILPGLLAWKEPTQG